MNTICLEFAAASDNDLRAATMDAPNARLLGPRRGPWLMDPADPGTWTVHSLRYSRHAEERAAERGIPTPRRLPCGSRLADLDKSGTSIEAAVFKVPAQSPGERDYFAVVSADGCVVTVFHKGAEWNRWQTAKRERRDAEERVV